MAYLNFRDFGTKFTLWVLLLSMTYWLFLFVVPLHYLYIQYVAPKSQIHSCTCERRPVEGKFCDKCGRPLQSHTFAFSFRTYAMLPIIISILSFTLSVVFSFISI